MQGINKVGFWKAFFASLFLLIFIALSFFSAPKIVFADPLDGSANADAEAGVGDNKTEKILGEEFTKYSEETKVGENNDDPIEVVNKFLVWGMGFASIVAVGFIIYGGFTYIMAGGNEENIKRGKSLVMKAAIGLIIILAAWLIITTIVGLLKGNDEEENRRRGTEGIERGGLPVRDDDLAPIR